MRFRGMEMEVTRARTVVVGSGCAGLNCADWLAALGEDALLLTDGMNRGTSRNAGSDKQTYYKLSVAGGAPDSVADMTRDLLSEGVNGDTALVEAACSVQCFFKLAQLGVPFPANEYGEYVGYRTDHDTRGRATSAGPLTSKRMTECLERSVRERGVRVMDNTTAFSVLKTGDGAAGVLAFDTARRKLVMVLAAHVVLATGGPASVYEASVYPESQSGMTGMAIAAGARMANLHQWQYGLASVKFRWNVSGSYQQVLPRFVSVDAEGVEREFLLGELKNEFLKGYQWPFDTRKVSGSSKVDLMAHRENALGRRVYMDFRRNPSDLNWNTLDEEAAAYLRATGAVQDTPIARLTHMNAPAVQLYRDHGIDLEREMLEVRVCAQHHNGGAAVDSAWRTSVEGLYAVGEAAGTFGAYRPGGSALNAAQVGSMRAAQSIAWDSRRGIPEASRIPFAELERALDGLAFDAPTQTGEYFRREMSRSAAHFRDLNAISKLKEEIKATLERARGAADALPDDFEERIRLRDQLLTQYSTLSAMERAAALYGSTGSGLIADPQGEIDLPQLHARARAHSDVSVSFVIYTENGESTAQPARPVPKGEAVFENAWRSFRQRTERA